MFTDSSPHKLCDDKLRKGFMIRITAHHFGKREKLK